MRYLNIPLTAACLALLAPACSPPDDQRAEFFVFGTLVEVLVRDADRKPASVAFGELQQQFQGMHRDWHAWEPGKLMEINLAFAQGQEIDAPPDILALISRSQELEIRTGGRFNAALGGLVKLWGFHTSDYPVHGPVPSREEIQRLLDLKPSATDILVAGNKVSSSNPSVKLDFGGIAKGFAVDLAFGTLAEHGFHAVLVNAGGDLKATGGTADRPWRVGISRPGGGIIGGIEISGSDAVFTSGVNERYLQQAESRYPHILDPFSGQPVSGLASATVIASDATMADAAATALMVAGLNDWSEVADGLQLDKVLLVDVQGTVHLTPAMNERFKPATGVSVQLLERVVQP